MFQMDIDPFMHVRATIVFIQKALYSRKNVDRHMINNVRIWARKRNLVIDDVNIDIDPKYLNTYFITDYNKSADNYLERK